MLDFRYWILDKNRVKAQGLSILDFGLKITSSEFKAEIKDFRLEV
jgi:hypothetical protein